MRRAVIVAGVVVAVGAVVAVAANRDSEESVPLAPRSLAERIIAAGEVEMSVEPIRLDSSGAVFRVGLNTHSGDLGMDLEVSARLEVDGVEWGGAVWTGDPPGGHHRQGTLSFEAGGPARGAVRLRVDGLPAPVTARWQLG